MRTAFSFGQFFTVFVLAVMLVTSGCVPPVQNSRRPSAAYNPNRFQETRLNRLTPTIATNENITDVQFVADYTPNQATKELADQRVLQLIGQCQDLKNLLFLSVHVPLCTHADDARQRAETLLTSWCSAGPDNITNILPGIYSPSKYERPIPGRIATVPSLVNSQQTISNVIASSLEASVVNAAKQLLTNSYEQVTEEDYRRDFTIQGEVLEPLVTKIKSNYHHTDVENVNITYSVAGGQGQLFVNSEPSYSRYGGVSAMLREGIRRDSFRMPGLAYERFRYIGNDIVCEIVRREGSNGRAVTTEVITWDAIHYRKSTVEGF